MIIGINKSLKKIMNRFGRSQDGVTAIEFAFVGGPFLYLFIATFELGTMLFAEYSLAQNVESAGRLIRTGQIQNGQNGHLATAAYFRSRVCLNLTSLLKCDSNLHVDVRKFTNFADIAGNLPSPFTPGTSELSPDITQNSAYEGSNAGEIVSIRVYYDWDIFVPGLGVLLTLSTQGSTPPSFANITGSGGNKATRLLTAAATFRNEPFI